METLLRCTSGSEMEQRLLVPSFLIFTLVWSLPETVAITPALPLMRGGVSPPLLDYLVSQVMYISSQACWKLYNKMVLFITMHQLLFCFTEVYQFRVELDISKGLNMTIEEVYTSDSIINNGDNELFSAHTAHTEKCGHYCWSCHSVLHENTEHHVKVSPPSAPLLCAYWHLNSSHPDRTASLLVTVQSVAGSASIVRALSTWFSRVASSTTVESLQIVRYGASEASCQYQIPDYVHFLTCTETAIYSNIIQFMFTAFFSPLYTSDGCPEETLPLLSSSLLFAGDTSSTFSWPETNLGDPVLHQPCPNQAGSINTVSRYCGGSFSSGAQWSDVDFSQCSVWVSWACMKCGGI